MTKILAEMKSTKDVSTQLQSIKLLFFGNHKDVKVDKEYQAKRKCLDSLSNTLPSSKQHDFKSFFEQIYDYGGKRDLSPGNWIRDYTCRYFGNYNLINWLKLNDQ